MSILPEKEFKATVTKTLTQAKRNTVRTSTTTKNRKHKNNESEILEKASVIYDMVVHNKKPKLTENSCDFKLLERAYKEYLMKNK